jgi:hypothetical protein
MTDIEEKVLQEVVDRYYSELKDLNIQVKIGWLISTSYGMIFTIGGVGARYIPWEKKYIIFWDDNLIKISEKDRESLYKGMIAHELSHLVRILREEDERSASKKLTNLLKKLPVFRSIIQHREELEYDEDVIKRGLGRELLLTKRVLGKSLKALGNRINGYSAEEIEDMIK